MDFGIYNFVSFEQVLSVIFTICYNIVLIGAADRDFDFFRVLMTEIMIMKI